MPSSECPGYDTKQSNNESSVILECWEMRSTTSLSLLSGPLSSGEVAPNKVVLMGQIGLFDISTEV